MKKLYLFLVLPAFFFTSRAQSIHGIWSGTLENDSTHRIQNFELGLSEYRGKITGYTYTTFINNDTFYYSIKRIKAERKDGKLVIEDVEMVGNNFPEKIAKHVKQTTVFPLINDSTIDITNGKWSTNQTKYYYSLGGSATVQEQHDEKQSDLLAHLQEANIKTDVTVNQRKGNGNTAVATSLPSTRSIQTNNSTVADRKNNDIVKNKEPETFQSGTVPDSTLADSGKKQTIALDNKTETIETKPGTNASPKQIVIPTTRNTQQDNGGNMNKTARENKPSVPTRNPAQNNGTSTAQTQARDTAIGKGPRQVQVNSMTITAPTGVKKDLIDKSKDLPAIVTDRKNGKIQEDIYFKNDSLVLSLYDNGIVDGDTVSVFMNGAPIFLKQMLKAVATKRTVYFSAATDTVQLVLFAENLGSIPPNTGLLIIKDGDESYQVHFTADLQTNASITLRRKK